MKKMMFLATLMLLLIMMLVPCYAATDPAVPFNITVLDQADFMTDEEEATIAAQQGAKTYGVEFYVITSTYQMYRYEVIDLCEVDEDDAVVALVIDSTETGYYTYCYEMFTFNTADRMFSDNEVDAILDDLSIYQALKSGNWTVGCANFFARCAGVVNREHQEALEREARRPLMAVITGLVVGVLVGGGAVLGVFLYYRKKQHGESYPLDRYARLQLTESQDRFVGSYVTRVRVQSNNGGGGGGRASGGSRGRR